MKALITGGAGFIGSHLTNKLLKAENAEKIVIYDNFSSGKRGYIEPLLSDPRLAVVEGDLKDLSKLREAMEGCDTVFHLAANPDIARAATQPDIDFWEGTYLTQNVLEGMRLTGGQNIFYTSGSGVYGEAPSISFREDYGPCIPISTYGASKLACEGLIASYCHMFGLFGRAFRFANVVGPRQTHGVGYDFIRNLKADPTRLRILGDGSQRKSYIHVDDVLAAITTVGAADGLSYDVFNVATDDYITVRQIADLVVRKIGLDPKTVRYEFTGGDRGWKGDVPIVRFDCGKIKALGWRCRHTSVEAMSRAIEAMSAEVATDGA